MEFGEAFDRALTAGTGRQSDGNRNIPAFVPSGTMQNDLFKATINHMLGAGFRLFDTRDSGGCGYKQALNSFSLSWPRCHGTSQVEENLYRLKVPESEKRLLVVCGSERMPRFWAHLSRSNALHIGAVFPPFLEPEDKCIIVPNVVCVCALVTEDDLPNISGNCIDPVYRYTSQSAMWLG